MTASVPYYTDEEVEQIKKIIISTVNAMGPDVTESEKKAHADVLYKVIILGMLPKDAMGISDQKMEELYSSGYNLFKAGKFDKSALIFKMLSSYNPSEAKYFLAQGASYQQMEEYQQAVNAYLACSAIDDSPLPLYYASDCYIKLNQPLMAISVLHATLNRCGDVELYKNIKHTSKIMYENLCKEHKIPITKF